MLKHLQVADLTGTGRIASSSHVSIYICNSHGSARVEGAHLRNGGKLLEPANLHEHPEADEAVLAEDAAQARHLCTVPPARCQQLSIGQAKDMPLNTSPT